MKDIVTGLLSLVAVIVSLVALHRTSRNESFSRRQAYNRDFRIWADKVIECISDARHLTLLSSESSNPSAVVASRLSALADGGRLFFQNRPDSSQMNKPSGFAGYRPRILDWLICAYKLTCHVTAEERNEFLRDMQVGFTRDAQCVLSPGSPGVDMEDLHRLLSRGDGIMETTQTEPTLKKTIAFLAGRGINP
jgi:hypothetical protein